jgi:4-amino-4-deoxy-L-arabinose transferase-like glycosyltransferase
VDLVFITITGGKRQHYILPLMPAMAILIGILMEDMVFVRKAYTSKYARDILQNHIIVLITAVVAGIVYVAKAYPQLLAGVIIIGIVTIVSSAVIAVLFARGKPALGCGVVFAGIVALVMIAYIVFVNPLNYNEPSRQFTQIVAEKVPASEKLVAYKSASTRFIHYFGRCVPEITTESETYRLYNEGWWVVAFGKYLDELQFKIWLRQLFLLCNLDELLQNGQFEIVYIQDNAERHKGKVVGGALLHKSTTVAKDHT